MRVTKNMGYPEKERIVLLVTTLAAFLSPFATSSVNIALPSIGKEFRIDAILLSWVTTAHLLATAIFLVPFGKIADLYGKKRIFTYGILTFTLASIGCSLSTSAMMLIGFRILQGIGSAAIYPIGAAMLTSVFPSRELGKALGINVAAVYLGGSLGPSLGGFFTQHFGWRSIFFLNLILGVTIIVLIFWKLEGEWYEGEERKFDFAGSVLYSFMLLLIMYGFFNFSRMLGVWLVLFGALGMVAFMKWEMQVENPVLDLHLFKENKVFAFSSLATLINYSATFAVTFLLSLYLQYIKNLTPQKAGLILVFQPIVQAFCSPFAGKLSDRIEPRIVASTGMALTSIGLFLMAILSEKTGVGFVVANLILLGLGFAFFSSPNTNAVMQSVGNKSYGMASGTISTMRVIGMVFSMGITALMLSLFVGKVEITPEYFPAYLRGQRLGFLFFALLCVGGTLTSLARGKVSRPRS